MERQHFKLEGLWPTFPSIPFEFHDFPYIFFPQRKCFFLESSPKVFLEGFPPSFSCLQEVHVRYSGGGAQYGMEETW